MTPSEVRLPTVPPGWYPGDHDLARIHLPLDDWYHLVDSRCECDGVCECEGEET